MRLIIDIDDDTCQNIWFYGECLGPRDKENLERALKNARLAEERPKGKWIEIMYTEDRTGKKCSECGYRYGGIYGSNYCPNCGADMRGDGR